MMKEIKEMFTNNEKTYAQAAARNTNIAPHTHKHHESVDNKAQQTMQTQGKLQAKNEITLSIENTHEESKKELKNMTPNEITKRCQLAIDKANIKGIKLQGINKQQNGNIRIYCKTTEERKELEKVDWNEAVEGLEERASKYDIITHGVPTNAINFTNDKQSIIAEMQEANQSQNISIIDVIPFRRKSRDNHKATHQSIIIFTSDSQAVNRCILGEGIYIDSTRYPVERYTPQLRIIQCFKCYKYGHRADQCKHTCGKCASNHDINECINETIKCSNCEGDHHAWRYECLKWSAESKRMPEIKANISETFTK